MADHESGEVEEEDENVYELMIELRRSEPGNQFGPCVMLLRKTLGLVNSWCLVFAVMWIVDKGLFVEAEVELTELHVN